MVICIQVAPLSLLVSLPASNSGHYHGSSLHLWNALVDALGATFINNKAANAMLTRTYRKGFEVPPPGNV